MRNAAIILLLMKQAKPHALIGLPVLQPYHSVLTHKPQNKPAETSDGRQVIEMVIKKVIEIVATGW